MINHEALVAETVAKLREFGVTGLIQIVDAEGGDTLIVFPTRTRAGRQFTLERIDRWLMDQPGHAKVIVDSCYVDDDDVAAGILGRPVTDDRRQNTGRRRFDKLRMKIGDSLRRAYRWGRRK